MAERKNIITYFCNLMKVVIHDDISHHNIADKLALNMIHTMQIARRIKYIPDELSFLDTTAFTFSNRHSDNRIETIHYYLDLLRKKNSCEVGNALHNIIRTMRVSRHNIICGENFCDLDLENIPLNGIQWSVDEKNTTSFDRSIINETCIMGGHTGEISALIWTYDGRRILTGGEDGKIILWDAESGLLIRSFIGHTNKITDLNIGLDSEIFISSAYDGTVRVWSFKTDECMYCLKHSSAVLTAIIINQNQCLTGSEDMTIKLWDFKKGECISNFEGQTNSVKSLCLLPDKQHCLIASWNRPVKCLDFSDFNFNSILPVFATTVRVCSDGSKCVTDSYSDRSAKVWELKKGTCIKTLKDRDKPITAVDISTSGEMCLTGTKDGVIIIWDVLKGTVYKRIRAHTEAITTVKFDPIGKQCATASKDGMIKILSLLTGKCIQTLHTVTSKITSVTLSADRKKIFTGQNYGVIKQWNASMPTFLFRKIFNSNCKIIDQIALSPNQQLLLLKRKGENIISIDLRSNEETEWAGSRCQEQCFVSFIDDTFCLTGHYQSTIALLDTVNNSIIIKYKGHKRLVSAIAASHDGKIFVSGSYDTSARLWDIGTGKCIGKLEGHKKIINYVALSYGNEYVLTCSNDKAIKLWDVETFTCIHTFKGHLSRVLFASFTTDDKSFISYSEDGCIKLWEITSTDCKATHQLSLKDSDVVSWFFPYFVIYNNCICNIYKLDCNAENDGLSIDLIGRIYNAEDLQITHCSFKNAIVNKITYDILYQYGAEL